MPRSKTFLSPAEYAVLGLVRQKSTYGYELQRQLSGPRGLGSICPVEPAMVYAILKSLSGMGLIAGEWQTSAYPPKAIFTATQAGEAEFMRWLARPVGRVREMRVDFLVKLYFALQESPDMAGELLAAQIEACRDYERHIADRQDEVDGSSFDSIVLGSKASAVRITREWLEKTLSDLKVESKAS